jgi:hypothetical protein
MSRLSELIYPDAPGFKVSGPSEEAARAMSGIANKVTAVVLAQFARYPGGATADEIARDGTREGRSSQKNRMGGLARASEGHVQKFEGGDR